MTGVAPLLAGGRDLHNRHYPHQVRWWRRHAGVRVRSSVAAAVVLAVSLTAAMLGGWWLLERALTNAAIDAVTARNQDVVALVTGEGAAAMDPGLQPVVGEVVQVQDASGTVLAAAPSSAALMRLPVSQPSAGRSVSKVATLAFSGADEPYILVTSWVRDGVTKQNVAVVVGRSVAGLGETLGTVGQLGLVGLPLLVLITAGVTYVFTGRALAPVEAIRRRVRTITSRRLDERVPVPAVHDEIGRLAETMNDMLATLQAAQDAQQRFVADAGHELRSPLATIATAVDVARAEWDARPEQAQFLDDVASEASRMGRLVEDLLLLARADERGLRLRSVDVDLDDLVESEARRLRTPGDVQVTVRTQPVRVHGDPDRLAQVLRNLADNARRHCRSRLHLELRLEGDDAIVRVEDDGPGIDAQDRLRVFERFVRLDSSRTRVSGGSGLGLAIVKEIVAGQGGSVSMQTSELGGNAAEVRIPVSAAP